MDTSPCQGMFLLFLLFSSSLAAPNDWHQAGETGAWSQAQAVYLVAEPGAERVFGDKGGPYMGSLPHLELTLSQVKKEGQKSNWLLEWVARKVSFLERRQQRQAPSLEETAREFSNAAHLSCCAFLCYAFEFLHAYLRSNPLLGCLFLPCHVCLCCCCCFIFNCLGYKHEAAEEEEEYAEEPEVQMTQMTEPLLP